MRSYQALHDAFDALASCGRVAHIGAKGGVADRKRQAGASTLVRRTVIRPHRRPPKRVSTNVEVPAIPVGRQTLHFFPDKLLVLEPNAVGAVPYDQLRIDVRQSRFIEEEGVPPDAKVVGGTWRYVNKNGGPDRRFSNNPELPIALYEEIHFTSNSGLNEVIQVSQLGTAERIGAAVRGMTSESTQPLEQRP